MKNGVRLSSFFLLLFVLCAQIFARGKTEESEVQTHNDEWILCITDFDVSSLPAEKLAVAGVITREITERLRLINYRTRISPEYAYYEEYAWARARAAAARALSAKIEERSQQIYRGEPQWRFRQNITRIDADIEKLRLALEEIENNAPLINREPVFNLTGGNLQYVFPSAPAAGVENRFCTTQKADAFLSGSIVDFHGRFLLAVKLYTVYTRSFVWEDSIIFSHEDLVGALDEITRRLIIVLSGNRPAAVAITAEPEETLLLINRSFAGRGETPVLEYPPGRITVTASAPDHDSVTFETDLFPGEMTEININLNPIGFGDVEVTGDSSGSVYQGALYVGEAPLTLRLPAYEMEYFELETPDLHRGTIVFQAPDYAGFSMSLSLRTGEPLQRGRVDRARRAYYWAWGATWVTGIAAWIAYHSFLSSNMAIRYNYSATGNFDQQFMDESMRMYNISMGTLIAVGVVVVYDIFQMIRYVYISDKGTARAVRGRN